MKLAECIFAMRRPSSPSSIVAITVPRPSESGAQELLSHLQNKGPLPLGVEMIVGKAAGVGVAVARAEATNLFSRSETDRKRTKKISISTRKKSESVINKILSPEPFLAI